MKHKYNKHITIGYDLNGKRIRKWIHADSIRELNEKTEQVKMEQKLAPNTSDVRFGRYSQEWFRAYKSTRSARTQEMYRYALSKCSDLAKIQLKSVTKTACQQLVNALWETPKTAKIVRDTLCQIFKAAVADGILIRNPAEGISVPEQNKKKIHLLTDQELEAVKNAELDPQDRMFVTILQVFGLRPAEALALQINDFDFKKKILTISRAVELGNDNQSSIKGTKTGKTREIPIPDAIMPVLKSYIAELRSFLLFPKRDGGVMTKSSYRRMSERVWKAVNVAMGGDESHNLVSGRNFYEFRHRRCTDLYYLCQKGIISTKMAAELGGHSEEVFIRIYSHIDENKERVKEIYPDLNKILLVQNGTERAGNG